MDNMGRLFDAIVAARLHYGIWYVYKNEIDRPKYVDVMNRYYWFFAPSISAHFVAMLMALSTLYDDGPINVSVSKLLQEIRDTGKTDEGSLREVKGRLEKTGPIVKKIMLLRNNVFAHLSVKIDPFEAFEKANITMNNFRDLIYETAAILNQMGQASGYGTRDLVESSELDTRDMLGVLERIRVEVQAASS